MSSRLWATSAALLLLGGLMMAFLGSRDDDADRFADSRFVAQANARCAATELEVVTPNRGHLDGPAEARRIDRLATGWEQMVDDLRALPRTSADAPKIDRWLRAWDQWTALGHQYADALREEDEAEAASILRSSEVQNATMTRVALVNGMNDCLFRS